MTLATTVDKLLRAAAGTVTKDPVHLRDLHATILQQMGTDHNRLVYPYRGLDQKLTGVEPAKVIAPILA